MSLELKSGDVHGQNLKTRRKNTTKACDECRRRRAKCDGKQPTCTRCNDRGLLCHFSAHEDGRRPAPKSYVDMLRKRISVLEKVLEAHSIDVESSVAQILAQERAKNGPGDASGSATVEESLSGFDGVLSLDENAALDREDQSYFGSSNGHLGSQILTPDGEPDDPFNNTVPSPTKPGFSQFRLRVDQLLIQDVAFSCEVSKELEAHLIDMYFLWEQPWCQVVNERLFRQSLGTQGRYASPLLLSCVLAAGSRFSDSLEVRSDPDDANTAGQMFIEKAEKLLYYELKWPSMTTIQSASIMGTLYLAIGADAAGWLHHGIASRLAVDMGLNMDATCLVGNNLMSREEVDVRNQIYWSLYCVDKMLASYIGRVCTMLDSQGQVPMPKRPDAGRDIIKRDARVIQGANVDRDQMRTSLHIAMMSLCCILEKILVALYAPSLATRQVQRGSFVHSCLLELKGWFYDLPQELKLDRKGNTNRLPQAYILHMSYHTQHILIMKPFLVKPVTISAEPHAQPGQNPEIVTQQALSVCYKAATSILDIIKKYQQAFGSFRSAPLSAAHCTLSAALIFIQTRPLGLDGRGGSTDCNNIELCLKVLQELSVAWSPARSMHKNLSKLYEQEFAITPIRPMGPVFDPATHHPPMVIPVPHGGKGPQFRGMPAMPSQNPMNPQVRMMTDDDIWNAEWPDTIMEAPLFPDVSLDFMSQSLPGDYTNFDNLSRNFHS
ncbi:fungal-specific transcription factor domain-domain-containing protein [Microdochium bolleyi]|uniref:Fungal-specific transcription factor domain-domain-containing protein n=1 Tax=Microdochium bolleyi TaxID=196109 RepID=A0A136J0S8_9PEZI|nr:fungal-specific transcription factor domain-domain-containing protein [Microdochium bolleyi]